MDGGETSREDHSRKLFWKGVAADGLTRRRRRQCRCRLCCQPCPACHGRTSAQRRDGASRDEAEILEYERL